MRTSSKIAGWVVAVVAVVAAGAVASGCGSRESAATVAVPVRGVADERLSAVVPEDVLIRAACTYARAVAVVRLVTTPAASTEVILVHALRGHDLLRRFTVSGLAQLIPNARAGSEWIIAAEHGGITRTADALVAVPAAERDRVVRLMGDPWVHRPYVAIVRITGVAADPAYDDRDRVTYEVVRSLRGKLPGVLTTSLARDVATPSAAGPAPHLLTAWYVDDKTGGVLVSDLAALAAGDVESLEGRVAPRATDDDPLPALVDAWSAWPDDGTPPRFAVRPVDDAAFTATAAPVHAAAGQRVLEPDVDLGTLHDGRWVTFEVVRAHGVPQEDGGTYGWIHARAVQVPTTTDATVADWMFAGPGVPAWPVGSRWWGFSIVAGDRRLFLAHAFVPDAPFFAHRVLRVVRKARKYRQPR